MMIFNLDHHLDYKIYNRSCACRTGEETLFHFLYESDILYVLIDHFMTAWYILTYDLGNLGLTDYSIPMLFHSESLLPRATILRTQQAVCRFIVSSLIVL